MAEIPKMEVSVEVKMTEIHIGKGDFLAIQSDRDLSGHERDNLISSVKSFLEENGLKDVPIMVLDRGLRVIVVHREEEA